MSDAISILITFQIEHILKIIHGIIVRKNNTSGADRSSFAMRPMNESGGHKSCNLDVFFSAKNLTHSAQSATTWTQVMTEKCNK